VKIKIGIVQARVYANKKRNLAAASESVRRAAEAGADLVALPEMFNCPYSTAAFPVYAEREGGESWKLLSEAAKRNAVVLAGGSMPELSEDGGVYNTSYIFDEAGAQIGKHRKMHLFDVDIEGGQRFKESDTLRAGNEVTVFPTRFGTMGTAVCYDFRFPELARIMTLRGAKILIIPGAFNMTTGPAHWELLFRQRAVDNQVFTIGVAPARDLDAAYVSYGNSIAVSPWGEVLYRMDEREGTMLVELDLELVDRVRAQLPLLEHRRTDVYEILEKGQIPK